MTRAGLDSASPLNSGSKPITPPAPARVHHSLDSGSNPFKGGEDDAGAFKRPYGFDPFFGPIIDEAAGPFARVQAKELEEEPQILVDLNLQRKSDKPKPLIHHGDKPKPLIHHGAQIQPTHHRAHLGPSLPCSQ